MNHWFLPDMEFLILLSSNSLCIVHIDLRALYLAKQHQSKWLYIIPETYQKFCPSMTEFGGTTPLIEQVAHYIRHLQGHITNPSQTKNY